MPLLDALRGLCALIVLVHHAHSLFPATAARLASSAPWLEAAWRAIGHANTEAVLLFFVLSGFSIRLSIETRPLSEARGLRDYARRRLARIVPAYGFALAFSAFVAWVFAPASADAMSLRTLLGNLLFLQTAMGVPGQWFPPYANNGALWSLSFEMFYYLSFPLLVRSVAGRTQRWVAVLVITCAGVLLGRLLPSPFTMFLGASLIWYFGVELAQVYLVGTLPWPRWALLCIWALLGVFSYAHVVPEAYGLWFGCTLFVAGLVVVRKREQFSAVDRALSPWLLEPLARVGATSYALYLLHVPVLRACVARCGDNALSMWLAAALSFALAYLVERVAQPRRDAASSLETKIHLS